MEPLSAQLYAFGIVLLAGISLGLFLDLFRVVRGLLRPGLVSTPLLDLLFWVFFFPIFAMYLLLANWGELRGYVLLGLGLGFFFYRLLLSGMVISFLVWLFKTISGLLALVVNFVVWAGSFPLILFQEIGLRRPGPRLRSWLKPRLRWRK